MPMFPDSGVPAAEAKNSLPHVPTAGCPELWYSTSRCQPRFDPAAANAMLAEQMNLIMKAEMVYDCTNLDHVERAARYLIQRGLARSAYCFGGPTHYTASLDPVCTRYNNFMTLTIITETTCNDGPDLNIDHLGVCPILRNDGQPLEQGDLIAGIPAIIAFTNGVWILCGLAASQVPLIIKGGIDAWIRTDGNDTTGDGTANTPDKAFKTIQGCWSAIGSRYATTPLFYINMRFGIPGTYDGAVIGPFGCRVFLQGDVFDAKSYRIKTINVGELYTDLWVNNVASMFIIGVTFVQDVPTTYGASLLRCLTGSIVEASCCEFDVINAHPGCVLIEAGYGGMFATISLGRDDTSLKFWGHDNQIGAVFNAYMGGRVQGSFHQSYQTETWTWDHLNCASGFINGASLASMMFSSVTNFIINTCVGTKYNLSTNATLEMGGKANPGTGAGLISTGAQFVP